MSEVRKISYGRGIFEAFDYLLENHPEVFVIGQGLWSPWYVGTTMTDLDKKYGTERVIDCPVSELATTGAAIGAATCGYKPIIVHPRMDFMVLALDQIISQAAKWRHMFGNNSSAPVTVRSIINRGGEQGAQHSQALHSWLAHIPGLRVVMPATAKDARDLLIASVLSEDPVVYIDDRWLYEQESQVSEPEVLDLKNIKPLILEEGSDVTLVSAGHETKTCLIAAENMKKIGISAEVIDLRMVNPIDFDLVINSVKKTGRLLAVDGGWTNCGLAGEIIAAVSTKVAPSNFKSSPQRITLTDAPAPTAKNLEQIYYISSSQIEQIVQSILENEAVV